MNTWLAEKRESYTSSRSSSVGNFFGSSSNKEKVGSTNSSKKASKKPSNGNKRKGRRPQPKSKREQEEARRTRVQLAETDDSWQGRLGAVLVVCPATVRASS